MMANLVKDGNRLQMERNKLEMDENVGKLKYTEENIRHGMNGDGVKPGDGDRSCSCCPYGYHIDRGFLDLVSDSHMNDVELRELKRMHRQKLRHRENMELLLMQSVLPPTDISEQMESPSTPSDAGQSDASLNAESPIDGEGTVSNSILSELDDTITEAMRSIDELMNSKRRPSLETTGDSTDTGGGLINRPSQSASFSVGGTSPEGEMGPPKKEIWTAFGEIHHTKNPVKAIDKTHGNSCTDKLGVEPIRELNGGSLSDLRLSSKQTMGIVEAVHDNSSAAVHAFNSLSLSSHAVHVNGLATHNVQETKYCKEILSTSGYEYREKKADDFPSSSDLAKALAVLLPYDGKTKVSPNMEALMRLRHYIVSSLRQMRNLEQQVKKIPVMHVRISVLKEEKKMLRLQLLSLQNSIQPAARGSLEDGGISPNSFGVPHLPLGSSSQRASVSNCAETEMCSRCHNPLKEQERSEEGGVKYLGHSVSFHDNVVFQHQKQEHLSKEVTRIAEQQRVVDISETLRNSSRQLQRTTSLNSSIYSVKRFKHDERDEDRITKFGGHKNSLESLNYNSDHFEKKGNDTRNAITESREMLKRVADQRLLIKFGSVTPLEISKTMNRSSIELQKTITASETNLSRSRWNAKSLEKLRTSPIQKTFNDPIKIRKVCLAKDVYTPPALPMTKQLASRQSFNAAIQCELIPSKPTTTVCCQCRCNANQRKPNYSQGGRLSEMNSGRCSNKTPRINRQNVHRQLSTPTEIFQTCGRNGSEVKVNERTLKSQGFVMDSQLPEECGKVEDCSDDSTNASTCLTEKMSLNVQSKEVCCSTEETWNLVHKKDASCLTEMFLLKQPSKEVSCSTDKTWNSVPTKDAGCLTEMFLLKQPSKEVSCFTDETWNSVLMKDASCLTEKFLLKQPSVEVSCSTDEILDRVLTNDASCFTEKFLLKRQAMDVSCSTDEILDNVQTSDASCFTETFLLRPSSMDASCFSDETWNHVPTNDASCLTEKFLLKRPSMDVSCSTDETLDRVLTNDASCFTEKFLLKRPSMDATCSTDEILDKVPTSDASCFTEKLLLKQKSVEVSCSTDESLDKVPTKDASCFTEKSLLKQLSKEVSCSTDETCNHVPTKDASCFTETFLLKRPSMDVSCSTDETLDKVPTSDASCLTEKFLLKRQAMDVSCSTDEILDRVLTNDASCWTEEFLLKRPSMDATCSTDEILDKVPTKDASCFTEKFLLKRQAMDVSCSTDEILTGVISKDASCSTDMSLLDKPSKDAICSTDEHFIRKDASSITEIAVPCDTKEEIVFAMDSSISSVKPDVSCYKDILHPCKETGASGVNQDHIQSTNMHCRACHSKNIAITTHSVGCNTDTITTRNNDDSGSLTDPCALISSEADSVISPEDFSTQCNNEINNNVIRSEGFRDDGLIVGCQNGNPSKDSSVVDPSNSSSIEPHSVQSTSSSTNSRVESSDASSSHTPISTSNKSSEARDNCEIQSKSSSTGDQVESSWSESATELKSELNEELNSACEIYSTWLLDSTEVTSKELNGSLKVIQKEWFSLTSQKTSNVSQVKKFIESLTVFPMDVKKHVINMVDTNENTALHYAVSNRNFDLIRHLLSTGVVDVNRRNRTGCTAAMLASLIKLENDEQRDTLRSLIKASDVNVTMTLTGQTALMFAASRDHRDTVRMLLDAKANPNLQDLDGSTALMCASEHGYIEVVKILLSQPVCDPCLRDNEGSTALSVAMEAGHRDIGVLLYAHINYRQNISQSVGRRRERKGSATNLKRI